VAALNAQLQEVQARLGQGPPPPEPAAAEDALAAARAGLERVQARRRELGAETARRQESLAALGRQPSAAQAQAALEELVARRQELAREHGVLVLARAALNRAMERFRLEAQPSLLTEAARRLERATGGAYRWLGSDLFAMQPGAEPGLAARSGPGAAERPAEVLSRGTRDQLYLCLRLALAQEMTAGGEPAPLILDDPLVNFDDARLAGFLELLAQEAESRQVWLLTCHREQRDLARQVARPRVLELAAGQA
jgi:uncharacterized protein YhaN